jgi:hypothetical protein
MACSQTGDAGHGRQMRVTNAFNNKYSILYSSKLLGLRIFLKQQILRYVKSFPNILRGLQ